MRRLVGTSEFGQRKTQSVHCRLNTERKIHICAAAADRVSSRANHAQANRRIYSTLEQTQSRGFGPDTNCQRQLPVEGPVTFSPRKILKLWSLEMRFLLL